MNPLFLVQPLISGHRSGGGDSTAMSSIEEYDSISRHNIRVVDEMGIETIKDSLTSGTFIEEKFNVGVGFI